MNSLAFILFPNLLHERVGSFFDATVRRHLDGKVIDFLGRKLGLGGFPEWHDFGIVRKAVDKDHGELRNGSCEVALDLKRGDEQRVETISGFGSHV
jgi:hypothetical protein